MLALVLLQATGEEIISRSGGTCTGQFLRHSQCLCSAFLCLGSIRAGEYRRTHACRAVEMGLTDDLGSMIIRTKSYVTAGYALEPHIPKYRPSTDTTPDANERFLRLLSKSQHPRGYLSRAICVGKCHRRKPDSNEYQIFAASVHIYPLPQRTHYWINGPSSNGLGVPIGTGTRVRRSSVYAGPVPSDHPGARAACGYGKWSLPGMFIGHYMVRLV